MNNIDDLKEILSRKEELLPELQMYLVEYTSLGKCLQHPLVYAVPFFPSMEAMYNEQFKQKKKYLEDCVEKKNWSSYIFMHERPYRFNISR